MSTELQRDSSAVFYTQEENLLFFKIASILTGYPDKYFFLEIIEILDQFPSTREYFSNRDGWRSIIENFANRESAERFADNLCSEYISTFDTNKQQNPLYETEYGRTRILAKGKELADISGFYRAFGLDSSENESNTEMPDHISVELEFYTLLLLKQQLYIEEGNSEAVEITVDAQKKFLESHLGRFAGAIARREGVIAHPFYGPIFQWIDALVEQECKLQQVKPDRIDYYGSSPEEETMNCGAINPINLKP